MFYFSPQFISSSSILMSCFLSCTLPSFYFMFPFLLSSPQPFLRLCSPLFSSSPPIFSCFMSSSLLCSLFVSSFPLLFPCASSPPLLPSSLPAVSQWRVNKGEVIRAVLSEPHPSHCHLILTAVTEYTQMCVRVHACV